MYVDTLPYVIGLRSIYRFATVICFVIGCSALLQLVQIDIQINYIVSTCGFVGDIRFVVDFVLQLVVHSINQTSGVWSLPPIICVHPPRWSASNAPCGIVEPVVTMLALTRDIASRRSLGDSGASLKRSWVKIDPQNLFRH